jgi:hypothetical protein
VAVPEVGLRRVFNILIVVVLPAPFGPRNPKISPSLTSKSIASTALTSPGKTLVKAVAWIIFIMVHLLTIGLFCCLSETGLIGMPEITSSLFLLLLR